MLTKVDISGHDRAAAWTAYFRAHYPALRIVQVESYIEKEAGAGHQGRKQYLPHLPQTFRERLVQTLQEVHAEMLEPPEKVKANPAWLETWRPMVKKEISWTAMMKADGGLVGHAIGGAAVPRSKEADDADQGPDPEQIQTEPDFLTVGVIGTDLGLRHL